MKLHQTFPKADRFQKQQTIDNFLQGDLWPIQKTTGPTFPKSQRQMFLRNSQTPGVGNYNIVYQRMINLHKKEPPYKINKEFLDYMNSRPKSVQFVHPGPGAYDLGSTLRSRGVSFTKAQTQQREERSPGPGQYSVYRPFYDLGCSLKRRGVSFTRAQTAYQRAEKSPGPSMNRPNSRI